MKWFLVILVLAAPPSTAQTPPDTRDGSEIHRLREQIRARWNQRVRQDLALSDDQAAKLQATEQQFLRRRMDLARRQREVNQALRGQLQPGIAANSDSVRRLMDAREHARAALTQIDRDEDKEIGGYLTPVQHARYQILREQLVKRIQQIREQRRGGGAGEAGRAGGAGGRRPPRRP
jgi:hypothetical protein